ncbi:(Dimethylallyl)adenosine tRNA methylthiotransferase MiaB [[Clostridium] cellulosi]|uniref:tRNA-2-methylthio-N(6)-dimethylallyladenosine synthase n=1 Tax=[Clostridium] cellulosi TaxID=29343 RepID=A0A078KUC6_9FIRM|nr:(Dimethylallyl)adenosine tRNA methylthiotransferase MiaB [[Clostridium] cellulosi]
MNEHDSIDYTLKVKELNDNRSAKNGRKPLAFIHTYGCQQNVSDSEHIAGLLSQMGFEFTDDVKKADLALYNTCAVREHAEQRVFGNIGALKGIKDRNPDMIIAVCGCMTQQKQVAEKFKRSYPYVDLVFGTHALPKLPEMLYNVMTKGRVFELGGEDVVTEGIPVRRDSKFKAWLPVMYGCNNFCTYCIVPYVRGRERSRTTEAIMDEAKKLVADGAREITLLGQNVNSYGKDLGGTINFSQLLRKINAIEGDFLIRFMTSHPKDATSELFDTMAECEKVAKHLHLPFQSGSNRILKLMNRRYTKEKYLSLIQEVKEKVPGISLTSDVIVGFPGETYEDFCETLDVVRQVEFDNLFTFIYSKREGTPAAKMEDPVTHEEKTKWMAELLAVQEEISARNMAKRVGRTERVLCENVKDGTVFGRTNENLVVRFDGDESLLGKFVNVKITRSDRSALFGELQNI